MPPILTPAMRDFLAETHFAVMTTINKDGSPQLTVMWYELQGNEIMLNTKQGRQKVYNIRRNPRVGFIVEAGYRYLALYGKVTLIEDQALAQEDVRRLAIRYLGEVEGEARVLAEYQKEARITIRMQIEQISALGFR